MAKSLEESLKKDVEDFGYELEYVECEKEGSTQYVRIVIDKESGITTEDCEKVSRALDEKVDKLVKYEAGYVLEVSSPGLERKLKNFKLYNKYLGSKVLIKVYEKINGQKELIGILQKVDENSIKLQIEDEVVNIEMKNISSGNTVYDFGEEE